MKNRAEFIKYKLNEPLKVYNEFIGNDHNIKQIDTAVGVMCKSILQKGKIMSCGNGGSMSDAMHFAQELSGRMKRERPPLPAFSISDPSYLTCVSNDYGYDKSFSRMVKALGRDGDTLLAISTSGNSENVIKAVKEANEIGINTVSLLGNNGGSVLEITNVPIIVPSAISSVVQEVHIRIIHVIIEAIENEVFFS